VGSVEELRACTLRLAVISRDFSGLRETALGELEMPCGEMDWEPDTTVPYTRELTPTRSRLKKVTRHFTSLGDYHRNRTTR
jgi:hypothetical protein